MRDRVRIVGGLYMGWAAVQAVGLATLTARWSDLQPRGGLLWAGWGLMLLLVVAFAVVGTLLWRHEPRARPVAIGLAVVALLWFPVGTTVGAYALWALLWRTPVRARA